MSKKGSGEGSGAYDYYGSIAGLVCEGPVDELNGLIVDGKMVWPSAPWWENGKEYFGNDLVKYLGRVWEAVGDHTADPTNAPPNPTYWQVFRVDLTAEANPYPFTVEGFGQAYLYRGTDDQELDTVDEVVLSSNGHPNYRGYCVLVLKQFLFGRERTSAPNVEIVVRRKPRCAILTGGPALFDDDGQANPLMCLAELISNQRSGLGLSLLDASTWSTVAGDLANNAARTYVSVSLAKGMSLRAIASELMGYYDGWLRWGDDGEIEAGRFLHDEDPVPVATITEHDLVDEMDVEAGGMADTVNEVVVKYQDRLRSWSDSGATAVSLQNRQQVGEPRQKRLDRSWITRAEQAMLHATEAVKVASIPPLSGTLAVRAEKCDLIKPGELFTLSHSTLGLTAIARCTDKTLAAPPRGTATIAWERERAIGVLPYYKPASGSGSIDLDAPEVLATDQVKFWQPPSTLAGGDRDQIVILAHRTSPTTEGLRVNMKKADGADYMDLGAQHYWCVKGLLAADYDAWVETVGTSSRARSGNVATIVTAAAHGLVEAQQVAISGLGGSGYSSGVHTVIEVINSTTFTFASVGSNEATTSDTGGVVTKYPPEDLTEDLQITPESDIPAEDWARFVVDLTEDQVNDADLLCVAFGSNGAEIMTVRSIRLDSGVYKLKVRRGRFSTDYLGFAAHDPVWLFWRKELKAYQHLWFGLYSGQGETLDFKLTTFTASAVQSLADATEMTYTFGDPNAPGVTWTSITVNNVPVDWFTHPTMRRGRSSNTGFLIFAGAINSAWIGRKIRVSGVGGSGYNTDAASVIWCGADGWGNYQINYSSPGTEEAMTSDTGGTIERWFAGTDVFQITAKFTDANGDLDYAAIVARLGGTETTLWSASLGGVKSYTQSVTFQLGAGRWKIVGRAQDRSGRITEVQLKAIGTSTEVEVPVYASGVCDTPTASPRGGSFSWFPKQITLSCTTTGATIKYRMANVGYYPTDSWSTYSGPISVGRDKSLYCYATKSGLTDSAVVVEHYEWDDRNESEGIPQ